MRCIRGVDQAEPGASSGALGEALAPALCKEVRTQMLNSPGFLRV